MREKQTADRGGKAECASQSCAGNKYRRRRSQQPSSENQVFLSTLRKPKPFLTYPPGEMAAGSTVPGTGAHVCEANIACLRAVDSTILLFFSPGGKVKTFGFSEGWKKTLVFRARLLVPLPTQLCGAHSAFPPRSAVCYLFSFG